MSEKQTTHPTLNTHSLHDALPIYTAAERARCNASAARPAAWRPCGESPPTASRTSTKPISAAPRTAWRSEEHTSELQSRRDLVCRLLLEKKKKLYNGREKQR